ncbi:HET-domain-containing protein [Hypoxylon rubiginosum]|uniref:HET-domain-containing protein n=1 Tax=Hypoxylon rubiginosum TaxID=110542 RepID=A0ACB9Z4G3_9PEZI|nr:HET-domain-containing protein [Hypoxylon rubiginosum]
MSSQAFYYSPLDSNLREIRVLTLLPGGFDEPLRVSVSTRSLDSNPIYNALSYVWGDPASARNPGNTISIDGSDFPVTTNLLAALRSLRPSAEAADPITLWVDAVCINQADLDERGQQVSMMRDIYASAEQVVIWLGEEDDETDLVFDALPMLATRSHRRGDEQDEKLLDATRLCSSFISGLADRRPWFSRVWIIQELAMAKQDPLVVCGRMSIAWSTLMKASAFVSRKIFTEIGMVRRKPQSNDSQSTPGNSSSGKMGDPSDEEENIELLAMWKIDVLDDLYQAMKSQGGESLRKLLTISRTSEATDPRDRIYGLLGLLKTDASNPQSSIVVDYHKPTAAVYADAMAYIFAQGDGPQFLSGVFLPGISAPAPHIPSLPPTVPQPPLPSWVPDISRQVGGKATQPRGTMFHPPAGISASGPGADCNNGKRLEDERTLQVEGLFVDKIEEVVFLGESLDSCLDQLAHVESLAKTAMQRPCLFDPSIRPHMEQFRDGEPLWKTLVSNKRFNSGYDPAPASYEATYTSLLNGPTEGGDWKSKIVDDDGQQSGYIECLRSKVGMKSFFTTKSGFVGTCVPDSRKGDVLAILFGSPVPFVLRPGSETITVSGSERPTHFLVGASYVSGIMAGEMVDELYCEDLMDSTTFFIR